MTRFAGDEGGNAMIIFGLMFSVMLMLVGGAVDFGRWLHARTQTWMAMDAAVLAGARALQVGGKDVKTAAVTTATRFYSANITKRQPVISDTIGFGLVENDTSVAASGNAEIETLVLGIIGINKLPLFNANQTQMPKSKLAIGGNAEADVEISLMLDITGSMSGSKIDDLKEAAKDMIDIVVWADQSQYKSRMALVPFSEAVNVGSTYATMVRGSLPSTISVDTGNGGNGQGNTGNTGNGGNGGGNSGNGNGNDSDIETYKLTTCVSERSGTDYAFTDDPPSVKYVGPVYTTSGSCKPASKLVPLTNNKTTLKDAIDQYSANGYTAGHIGTAWAWYTLSPNWNEVWPIESEPAPYSQITELNRFGYPKLRKIAVLMTDGEYNTQYCANGVSGRELSCGTPLGDSEAQAKKLCTAMKEKGIEVFTVGFQVSNSSKSFLKQCATSDANFYDATNGDGLKQAFNDIALKISLLYLSL